MARKKYTIVVIHLLLIKISLSSVTVQKRIHETWAADNIRVKRQDGYVYNKPNVSFDLPTRPSTVATVAPSSVKTQSQYMFYAYPAATKDADNTVNIGFSTTGATTASTATLAPSTRATPKVGVSSSTSGITGYNYGTQSSVSTGSQSGLCTPGYNCNTVSSTSGLTQASSSTSGTTGYNYGTPSSVPTGSQGSLCTSGYNCNTVSSTSGSTQASSSTSGTTGYNYGTPSSVPTGSQGSLCTSGNNCNTVSSNTGSTQTSSTSGTTGYDYGTPSSVPTGSQSGLCTSNYNCDTVSPNSFDTQVTGTISTNAPKYLPPLAGGGLTSNAGVSVSKPSSPGSTVSSVSIQPGTNAVQPITNAILPVKSEDSYLPPSSQSLGTSASSPSSTPVISSEYLPPVSVPGAGPTTTVSTPASTYLPPVF